MVWFSVAQREGKGLVIFGGQTRFRFLPPVLVLQHLFSPLSKVNSILPLLVIMAPANLRTHSFTCPRCRQTCRSYRGLLRHLDSAHRPPETPEGDSEGKDEDGEDHSYHYQHHPDLNGKSALIQ